MLVKIHLSNFRNFREKTLTFSEKTTVIIGPNASGKTNILESVFLLSSGKSFKARIEEEMVNYNAEIARVSGKVKDTKLEVMLSRGVIDVGTDKPERIAKKRLLVNGVPRRLVDFAGNLKAVFFGPQHMGLVTESPSTRRDFLNTIISQVDREYRRAMLSYEKGLRQRNRLLYRIREEGLPRTQLLFWNQLLIKNGNYISQKRMEFIDYVNMTEKLQGVSYQLEYDSSAISQARLDQYSEEEIAAGTTLVGPHRDDMLFRIQKAKSNNQRDLAKYGSRGEQRMGVLWLKLAELAYVEEKSGEKPTLLLDDIFSELDHEHREIVMEVVGKQQTIISTADPHFISGLDNLNKININ